MKPLLLLFASIAGLSGAYAVLSVEDSDHFMFSSSDSSRSRSSSSSSCNRAPPLSSSYSSCSSSDLSFEEPCYASYSSSSSSSGHCFDDSASSDPSAFYDSCSSSSSSSSMCDPRHPVPRPNGYLCRLRDCVKALHLIDRQPSFRGMEYFNRIRKQVKLYLDTPEGLTIEDMEAIQNEFGVTVYQSAGFQEFYTDDSGADVGTAVINVANMPSMRTMALNAPSYALSNGAAVYTFQKLADDGTYTIVALTFPVISLPRRQIRMKPCSLKPNGL